MQAAAADHNNGPLGSLPCQAGDYTLISELFHPEKESNWFKIWRAKCQVGRSEREFVIKIFDLDKNGEIFDDVQKEVAVMRGCSHRNIVQLHTSFVHKEELWMVLDYMDRGSVGDQLRLKFRGGFEESVIVYILQQALDAISYLHREEMIHRDIKADNLLIDHNFHVKVTDFWISSLGGDVKTKATTYVGTPCWMAPEVIEQEAGYDSKADIWSFGITLLELANGRTPFEGQKPLKVLKSILRLPPPSLEGNFSAELKAVVERCLQKDPAARPHAQDLLEGAPFKHSTRRAPPPECSLAALDSTPYQQAVPSPKGSWRSVEWTFDDVASLDSMSDLQLDRNISELVSECSSTDPFSRVLSDLSAGSDNTRTSSGIPGASPSHAAQSASVPTKNGLVRTPEEQDAQDAQHNGGLETEAAKPPAEPAATEPVASAEPDLSAFDGVLHEKRSSMEGVFGKMDDELENVDDHDKDGVNGLQNGVDGEHGADHVGQRYRKQSKRKDSYRRERSVSFDDVVHVLEGEGENNAVKENGRAEEVEASQQGNNKEREADGHREDGSRQNREVEAGTERQVPGEAKRAVAIPVDTHKLKLTKADSNGSNASNESGRSPGKHSHSPEGQDVWSELEKMLNEPCSPRSPRSPSPTRAASETGARSPAMRRPLERISSPVRTSPVEDPARPESDMEGGPPRRAHGHPPPIQTGGAMLRTPAHSMDETHTPALSPPVPRFSADYRRPGSSIGSTSSARTDRTNQSSPVHGPLPGHGHGIPPFAANSPSVRASMDGGPAPGERKKKFLITDANDTAGPREGSATSLSSGTASPGGVNPGGVTDSPAHAAFPSHRSSLDLRRRPSAEGDSLADGQGSGKPPLPPARPELSVAANEHASKGHGELLQEVAQTEVAPPLKGSQSLKDLCHPQSSGSSGTGKQRFQIKDVPSPDSASSAPTEVMMHVNGAHERASLDMPHLRLGKQHSPTLFHQQPAAQHRPPQGLAPEEHLQPRGRGSCEKIREEHGEGAGREDALESMDAAALQALVRQLRGEMQQLREERDALHLETTALRGQLQAQPPAAAATAATAATAAPQGGGGAGAAAAVAAGGAEAAAPRAAV